MKRIVQIGILLLLTVLLSCRVLAAASLVTDRADLLTPEEEQTVDARFRALSRQLDMDVAVLTVDSLEGKSPRAYAEDYYDTQGFRSDGVLLLISMEQRDYYITTGGAAVSTLSDRELRELEQEIRPYLRSGDYREAFLRYGEEVAHSVSSEGIDPGYLICIALAAAIGFIAVFVMKGQLKSVRPQNAATGYMVSGSFQLSQERDLFLFRNVSRVKRAQNTGGPMGASGRSHGGRGGKF